MRKLLFGLAVLGLQLGANATSAFAMAIPLENAYWRFESGTNGTQVAPPPDVVEDSANNNDMRTFNAATGPTYTTSVAPTPLQSGLPNNLALSFAPNQDIYSEGQNINNPLIENGFTLEAAFMPREINRFQAIVGKDGKPTAGPEQILALKMRGDTNELQIELFDDSGTIHGVRSSGPLAANQWYYAAVVNTGTSLSLYLDRNDGNGYVLQGTDPNALVGALWSGGDDGSSTDTNWVIGRGMFNGGVTDWFNGIIDEVRLTNRVLSPSEFLFAPIPEPSSAVLVLIGVLGSTFRVRSQRREL